MQKWKSFLRADPTAWLLEKNNPSVRYLTLANILDRTESDSEVKSAKAEVMKSGVVPRVLGRCGKEGWSGPGRFYKDKYKGTVWQLIILAEHEADGRDPRIAGACEYVLQHSQDPDSYGFAHVERASGPGGKHGEVIPCLTGNMIWSLIKLGYAKDERVMGGIKWITEYQRFDDGEGENPKGWPYDRYEMCWGGIPVTWVSVPLILAA